MDEEVIKQIKEHNRITRIAKMAKELYVASLGEYGRERCEELAEYYYQEGVDCGIN